MEVRLPPTLPPDARLENAVILTVDGRVVRDLLRGGHSAGNGALRWDGRDGAGRDAPNGVYPVRIGAAGRTRAGAFTWLRRVAPPDDSAAP